MQNSSAIFIIIGFENVEITQLCLRSFNNYLPNKYKLVLFDNGSSSPLENKLDLGRAEYVRSEKSPGFAKGCNWILKKYLNNSKVIALINNDIFINKTFSEKINEEINTFIASESVAFTPKLYFDSDYSKIENFGIKYFKSGLARQNRSFDTNKVLLNGAFLFLKTDSLKKSFDNEGYVMNPDFDFNAEDLEFSLRMLAKGKRFYISELLEAKHLQSQSLKSISNKSQILYWRNLRIIYWGTRDVSSIFLNLPWFIIGEVFNFGYAVKNKFLKNYLISWIEFFTSGNIVINLRKKYKKLDMDKIKPYIRGGVC